MPVSQMLEIVGKEFHVSFRSLIFFGSLKLLR